MNKEYAVNKDKAIVTDENGNLRTVDNSNNLDEILIQENIIEKLECFVDKMNKDINSIKQCGTLKTLFIIPIVYLLLGLFLLGISALIINLTKVNIFLQVLKIISCFIGIPFVLSEAIGIAAYLHNNKLLREANSELEYTEKKIKETKENLEELKKTKECRVSEDVVIKKVNDKEKLKELREKIRLYGDLAYSRRKYIRLYKKGKLEDKLSLQYSGEEVKEVCDYLVKQNPTLKKNLITK